MDRKANTQKGRLTALFNNQGWFWPNVLRHFWSLLWFGESMLPPATSGGNNVQVSLSIKELFKISIVLKLKNPNFQHVFLTVFCPQTFLIWAHLYIVTDFRLSIITLKKLLPLCKSHTRPSYVLMIIKWWQQGLDI